MTGGSQGWRPCASLANLRERAHLLERIRAFFRAAGVLEVETPVCSFHGVTTPTITSMVTRYVGPGDAAGTPMYLHTSPEFAMKRLLAAGSGPIYQICRVFRNGERGRMHNPEFTLLEWYRPGFDHHRLMDEVVHLIRSATGRRLPERRVTYAQLFTELLGVDPHRADVQGLRARAAELGLGGTEGLGLPDRDAWLWWPACWRVKA